MGEEVKDMDMAAAAEQLMQLSGDEDDDSKNDSSIISSPRTKIHNENINKRKNHKNVVAAQNRDHQIFDSLIMRPKKRTRYRSIIHLYMSTKPVQNVS